MGGKQVTETLTRPEVDPQHADTIPAGTPPAGPKESGPLTHTATGPNANKLSPVLGLDLARVLPAELPTLPPSLLERYECTGLLGQGGMGAVYRARDRQLQRDVALKFLLGDDPDLRLLREARSQARLDHPNACK